MAEYDISDGRICGTRGQHMGYQMAAYVALEGSTAASRGGIRGGRRQRAA